MAYHDAIPAIGDTIADKYKVIGLLGSGGMGAVLQTVHLVTGRHFAIKWMLPHAVESAVGVQRFIREAQVAGRVQHANIVEVYDIGRQGSSAFMVLELLQGESMQAYLTRKGALPLSEAVDLLQPIIQGVTAAHKAGVIHRDLKPENVFLAEPPDGSAAKVIPKILDFGISKVAADDPRSPVLTRTGMVIGTPQYMAPEQMRGSAVDHRADIYALGTMLYQMVSGQLPFRAESFPDLVYRVVTEDPVPLEQLCPEVPVAFGRAVSRAMAREPEDRIQSAADLGRVLEPFRAARHAVPMRRAATPNLEVPRPVLDQSLQTPFATSRKHARSPREPRRRSRWGLGLAGLLLIGASLTLGARQVLKREDVVPAFAAETAAAIRNALAEGPDVPVQTATPAVETTQDGSSRESTAGGVPPGSATSGGTRRNRAEPPATHGPAGVRPTTAAVSPAAAQAQAVNDAASRQPFARAASSATKATSTIRRAPRRFTADHAALNAQASSNARPRTEVEDAVATPAPPVLPNAAAFARPNAVSPGRQRAPAETTPPIPSPAPSAAPSAPSDASADGTEDAPNRADRPALAEPEPTSPEPPTTETKPATEQSRDKPATKLPPRGRSGLHLDVDEFL